MTAQRFLITLRLFATPGFPPAPGRSGPAHGRPWALPIRSGPSGLLTTPQRFYKISAPTARSTAFLMLAMPMPRDPSLPGMRMMAGTSSSLYRAMSPSIWAA